MPVNRQWPAHEQVPGMLQKELSEPSIRLLGLVYRILASLIAGQHPLVHAGPRSSDIGAPAAIQFKGKQVIHSAVIDTEVTPYIPPAS